MSWPTYSVQMQRIAANYASLRVICIPAVYVPVLHGVTETQMLATPCSKLPRQKSSSAATGAVCLEPVTTKTPL